MKNLSWHLFLLICIIAMICHKGIILSSTLGNYLSNGIFKSLKCSMLKTWWIETWM
jgi:hypothetical protein